MLEILKELWLDGKCDTPMVIVCYNIEELDIIVNAMLDTGRRRIKYDVYKEPGYYIVEIRFEYKVYLDFMCNLRRLGYNLKPITKVDIINVLIKEA